MSIFDRILGKASEASGATATLEAEPTIPAATTAPAAPSMTREEAAERIMEIAHRTIPATDQPTHFFVCSGNQSVIQAYHDLYRVGSGAYGGSAAMYAGDGSSLSARREGGSAVPFEGKRSMGSQSESVSDVGAVLAALGFEAMRGDAYVSYVTVGPTGVGWVREVYETVMNEAAGQGILPFWMFETTNADAAKYLLESLRAI
jgi:hypothetical protein